MDPACHDSPPAAPQLGALVGEQLADAAPGGPVMSELLANGTSLKYAEQGEGEPVIFVHGGSGDYRVWNQQMDSFSRTFRAITLSCRGYFPNRQLVADERITLETYADDLAAFARALDAGPVNLVGHSSPGGFGCLLLARRHPDLVRRLVLVEPPAFTLLGVNIPPKASQFLRLLATRPRTAAAFIRLGAQGIRPAARAFKRGDDEEGLRIFMTANLSREAFANMPPDRFRIALDNVAPLKAQIRAGFPAFSAQDARSTLVRTLLVSGERSNRAIRSTTDELERLLPDAERLNIRAASHNMFESHAEEFNGGVLAFLCQRP
jgi:pimeloyl-ACP methyl ester carboxylesterase